MKQKLCSLVSDATKYPNKCSIIGEDILKAVISDNDEFQIAYILHKLDPSLVFNNGKGPDFKLGKINVKVEAKSKLNRTYIADNIDRPIQVNKEICLRLLSRDAIKANVLSKAFDEQETDIAIISLSHNEFGYIFAAHTYGHNYENYQLEHAFCNAIDLVNRSILTMISLIK